MRIAYLLPYFTIVSGSFGGIKMQAVQWRDMLQKMGHEVVEINPWETYDWKSFDVIHFFFFGSSFFFPLFIFKTACTAGKICLFSGIRSALSVACI